MTISSFLSPDKWQLLMAPQGGAAGPSDMTPTLFMFGSVAVIFYFLMYRPQKKRQKAREELLKAVEKGDKVITAHGIHGTVAQVEDTTVLLQVSDNTKIRIEKTALGTVIPKNADKEAS
jgi:preprotein translocase subunit YajC